MLFLSVIAIILIEWPDKKKKSSLAGTLYLCGLFTTYLFCPLATPTRRGPVSVQAEAGINLFLNIWNATEKEAEKMRRKRRRPTSRCWPFDAMIESVHCHNVSTENTHKPRFFFPSIILNDHDLMASTYV